MQELNGFYETNKVENLESKPKRHKIKSRKAFEEEINEEAKRVTNNAFAVGVTGLVSIVCFSSLFNVDLDIAQKIGMLLLGVVDASGLVTSTKALVESISRKAKLENTYDIYYNIDEYSNSEKRGRSI